MMTRLILVEIILTSHIAGSIHIARKPTSVALTEVDEQPMELVYNRMSKTGGSKLSEILKQVVPDNHMIVGESDGLEQQLKAKNQTRQGTFVIGSIRNPCNIYLSNWAMFNDDASKGLERWYVNGETEKCFGKNEELLSPDMQPKTQKQFRSEQINAFRQWMRSKETEGMVSYRFSWKYLGGPFLQECSLCGPSSCMDLSEQRKRMEGDWSHESLADCWVNTDHFGQDLKRCLKMYEVKSGVHVKWDNFDKLVDPEHANKSGHGECKAYFDKETAKLVEQGIDKPIFDKFGFKECCA